MSQLPRRMFLTVTGSAALVPALPPLAEAAPAHIPYRFFTPEEADFMEAAVQRLIPPDGLGPSAMEAGVVNFIDAQLAGAWGAGERLYRPGPWLKGLPTQGYQLPFTPAQLFRSALRGIRADLARSRHPAFDKLPGPGQDAYLSALQLGKVDLGGVSSDVFFESLLAMTVEGYFSDPAYGGNRDMAAWRMIGFPGANGAYFDWVDRHGLAFDGPPRSLAQAGGRPNPDVMHGTHSMDGMHETHGETPTRQRR